MHRFVEFAILITFGFSGNHAAALAPKPPSFPLFPVNKPIPALKVPDLPQMPHLSTLPLPALPVAPSGTYPNTYAPGNCTTYVASRVKVPETWGNAATWASRAAAEGHIVSPIPIIGAIAQESLGLGHVAIVTAINGNQVEVSEMNVQGLGVVDTAWYPASLFNYIYI